MNLIDKSLTMIHYIFMTVILVFIPELYFIIDLFIDGRYNTIKKYVSIFYKKDYPTDPNDINKLEVKATFLLGILFIIHSKILMNLMDQFVTNSSICATTNTFQFSNMAISANMTILFNMSNLCILDYGIATLTIIMAIALYVHHKLILAENSK